MLSEYMAAKAIQGAAGAMGAASAMVFLSTTGTLDLISRLFLGFYLALIATPHTMTMLGMEPDTDNILLIGGSIGFVSWFVLGLAADYLNKLKERGGLMALIKDWRGDK